jgi:hypothetical protein
MKLSIVVAAVLCAPLYVSAQTTPTTPAAPAAPTVHKTCDDLKAEIGKKIEAHGTTNYTLTIVDKGKEADGKIVGSCGGGTKSIVYLRGTPAAQPKPADNQKPQ